VVRPQRAKDASFQFRKRLLMTLESAVHFSEEPERRFVRVIEDGRHMTVKSASGSVDAGRDET
jgi:hypothetical protein